MEQSLLFLLIFPPVALLVWVGFLWPVAQAMRDSKNWKQADKDLPILAEELDLKHKKKPGSHFGAYTGQWKHHRIRIEPDNSLTSIGITPNRKLSFDARYEAVSERKPLDIRYLSRRVSPLIYRLMGQDPDEAMGISKPDFSFEDKLVDSFFMRRQLIGNGGDFVANDSGVVSALREFISRNSARIQSFQIGEDVSCSLWVGSSTTKSRLYSVSGEQARTMLEEMLPVVEAIEKASVA